MWFNSFMTTFIQNILFMLGYMTNTNSFPKPLSAKEERELLQRMKENDEEARNTLIERNLRLVAFVAKKYSQTGKEADDLISIGTIGLIKAISTFDMEKGIRLATYAARCIENEILMILRSEKKLVNEVSLNEIIGMDCEGNEISLVDVLSNDEENVFNKVDLKIKTGKLYQAISSCLTPREKNIIELRYGLETGNPKTQREIAKSLGISRSYVSRIEKKAIGKLSKYFKEGK
ncbi:RNA polymerase sporulation sigma factor SigK [Acetivibrio sp. MSJd-27]|jgi:RNA polymerase sigma-K factor|uniref:RNA polymerase sporulation sigma factor SigK n=1 Tax=Acetivibrio sp. MSJd-27 TaxID=2841523 RepID=UPI0015AEA074|nr:RNA polymerase sporulation sigma factor SigK [Acetivibrio sp. MSJd-27]MBU5451491.1 RNA polymerase sporulation sigma factor SigK [Acetivibrio sp. MSJd-27]